MLTITLLYIEELISKEDTVIIKLIHMGVELVDNSTLKGNKT